MNTSLCKAAMEYTSKHGFSVIPVRKDKRPYVVWEQWQRKRAGPEQIRAWWEQWPKANVGIVTGRISNLAVIDVDSEEGREAIADYLPDTVLIPTCITPGGGQHHYFLYPHEIQLSNNTRAIPGCDLRAEGGYVVAPPSVNGRGKQYQWLEDLHIDSVEPPPLPQAYIDYVTSGNSCTKPQSKAGVAEEMFQPGRRDEDLFHTANCLTRGGMSSEEQVHVLNRVISTCRLLNERADPQWARRKVQSALKRLERKDINLTKELGKFVDVTSGYFSVTDCYNQLQAVTSKQKTAVRVAVHRLAERGLIEKYGQRDGLYRRVNNECEIIQWQKASTDDIALDWPFDLQKLIKTYPGNIIVIAGTSDSGKTAFLLDFIRRNMHRHEIHYFSSEMGDEELRVRLDLFENVTEEKWKQFTPWERSSNFVDVIKPDAINVIDFLEIYQEFYAVGAVIKQIHDKLRKGIALVAIQKNPGGELGRGGTFGLEKPRLYLMMEASKIKIVKAKGWRTETNPNGLSMTFKLVQGWKFIENSQWERKEG